MSSKKFEKEINDLHTLVSNLSPQSNGGEGYIEIVEPAKPSSSKVSGSTKSIIPPRRPPAPSTPDFFQRTFSFVGTMSRGYFAKAFAGLAAISLVVLGMLEERSIEEGWGMLMLGVIGWALLAALIKRWRDTGYNMWWLTAFGLAILPFPLNLGALMVALFLFFTPSKSSP